MRLKKIVLGGVAATALGVAGLVGSGAAFAASPAPVNSVTPVTTTSTEQAGVEAPDGAGSGVEAPGAVSDGPGGHQDPAGNVDHQFNGQE